MEPIEVFRFFIAYPIQTFVSAMAVMGVGSWLSEPRSYGNACRHCGSTRSDTQSQVDWEQTGKSMAAGGLRMLITGAGGGLVHTTSHMTCASCGAPWSVISRRRPALLRAVGKLVFWVSLAALGGSCAGGGFRALSFVLHL